MNVLNQKIRPNVYLLIYDAVTQRTKVYLGNAAIPNSSTQVVQVILLKSFSELNYYYNALSDNIGAENVGIVWKQDDNAHLRYLYIGQGLNGTVIGSDSSQNSDIIVQNTSGQTIVVMNSTGTDFYSAPDGSIITIPFGESYNFYGLLIGFSSINVFQYDGQGNLLNSYLSIPLGGIDSFVSDNNLKKIVISSAVFSIVNNSDIELYVSTNNSTNYVRLAANSELDNVIKYGKDFLARAGIVGAGNIDVTFYSNGNQILQLLGIAPNGAGHNIGNIDIDTIVIENAGTPPTPPDHGANINWLYQRTDSYGGDLVIKDNGSIVAQSLSEAISQSGSFATIGADLIEITGQAIEGIGQIFVKNITDNVVVGATGILKNVSFSFNAVVGKTYSITYNTYPS